MTLVLLTITLTLPLITALLVTIPASNVATVKILRFVPTVILMSVEF